MTYQEQFEQIAQEAIEKAEAIPCSLETFVKGLRDMEHAIRNRADLES